MSPVEADAAAGLQPLYPPTVEPSEGPLPLARFIPRFIRNPLRALPRAVYHEPMLVHPHARGGFAWVTDPALIERILLHEADDFPKTPLEKRIFEQTLGDGILTSQGQSWRWQRRTTAPLFRFQDLLAHVPVMVTAGEHQLRRWRVGPPGTVRRIEREMSDVTYDVFSHTILAGASRSDGEIIKTSGAEFLSRISWEIAWGMTRMPNWVWHPAKSSMRRSAAAMRGAVERIISDDRSVTVVVDGRPFIYNVEAGTTMDLTARKVMGTTQA